MTHPAGIEEKQELLEMELLVHTEDQPDNLSPESGLYTTSSLAKEHRPIAENYFPTPTSIFKQVSSAGPTLAITTNLIGQSSEGDFRPSCQTQNVTSGSSACHSDSPYYNLGCAAFKLGQHGKTFICGDLVTSLIGQITLTFVNICV